MMRKIVLLVCVLLAMPVVGQTTLVGAGATFPNPIYSKWFSEYHKLHSDVQVNYQSIGSGAGIRQVTLCCKATMRSGRRTGFPRAASDAKRSSRGAGTVCTT